MARRVGRQALAHLLFGVVEALDLGAGLLDERLRDDEDVPVPLVDPLAQVARVLDVLALVLPNRHVLRVAEHDVRGHHRWVRHPAAPYPFTSLTHPPLLQLRTPP